MISFLRGRLAEKRPPSLVIEVAGVGYEVEAPMSTFANLPATGEPLHLLTHLVVRDDAHLLFGFATEAERRLFRELIRVSKIGPKVAIGILSGITVTDFAKCVEESDTSRLVRLPGVGLKTAERLVLEMRDRLHAQQAAVAAAGLTEAAGDAPEQDVRREAFEALLALGYRHAEASRMLKGLDDVEGLDTAEIVRRALRG